MRPNIEALIFDVDGTLVDTNAAHVEVWRTVLRTIGLDLTPERIALEIGQGGDRLLHALLGPADAARLGPGLLRQWPETYRTHLRSAHIRAFPRTRELFAALRARSIRVACATSNSPELMTALLERVAIDLPEIIVTGDHVKATKPAPDIVRVAAERLNVPVERCVYVGDTPYDAMAATAAGARSWGVLTGSHSEAALRTAGAERIWSDVSALYADLDTLLAWAQKSNA